MDVRSVTTKSRIRTETRTETRTGARSETKAKAARAGTAKARSTEVRNTRTAVQPDEERRDEERPDGKRALTVTVSLPSAKQVVSGAVNTALLPVAVARKVLPAKGGLPLYLSLGVLGAADVVNWPVAIGVGVGYAVLRRSGPPAPAKAEAAEA
jgi:hypothetical protein